MDRLKSIYIAVTQRKGCDPFIGRKLGGLLARASFLDVQTHPVQPFAAKGPIKEAVLMTSHAIRQSVGEAEIETRDEMLRLLAELDAYAANPANIVGMPRVFQALGKKR